MRMREQDLSLSRKEWKTVGSVRIGIAHHNARRKNGISKFTWNNKTFLRFFLGYVYSYRAELSLRRWTKKWREDEHGGGEEREGWEVMTTTTTRRCDARTPRIYNRMLHIRNQMRTYRREVCGRSSRWLSIRMPSCCDERTVRNEANTCLQFRKLLNQSAEIFCITHFAENRGEKSSS